MTILTAAMILSGLGGNLLVIRFARSDLRQRKSCDRLLLLHISLVNLLGCCISLPLFYFDVEFLATVELDQNVSFSMCMLSLNFLFFCLRSGHFMLAVLCFDRFETITKGTQQKWMTYKKARQIIFTIYAVVLLILTAMLSGYVVDFVSEKTPLCLAQSRYITSGSSSDGKNISHFALIVETTLSISVANTACLVCLQKADNYVNQHIQSVRATLGEQSAIKEIRVVRSAWAFVIAYSVVWIPFGFGRIVRSIYPDSPEVDCFFIATHTLSYSVFSSIPILYIVTDKRIAVPYIRTVNPQQ